MHFVNTKKKRSNEPITSTQSSWLFRSLYPFDLFYCFCFLNFSITFPANGTWMEMIISFHFCFLLIRALRKVSFSFREENAFGHLYLIALLAPKHTRYTMNIEHDKRRNARSHAMAHDTPIRHTSWTIKHTTNGHGHADRLNELLCKIFHSFVFKLSNDREKRDSFVRWHGTRGTGFRFSQNKPF